MSYTIFSSNWLATSLLTNQPINKSIKQPNSTQSSKPTNQLPHQTTKSTNQHITEQKTEIIYATKSVS